MELHQQTALSQYCHTKFLYIIAQFSHNRNQFQKEKNERGKGKRILKF